MRLQLLSDLHLENDPGFVPQAAPGADLLVLAGDIGSYQAGSRLDEPDFGLARFAPGHGPWATVLYVPGNHEYDGLEHEEAHARLREACERLGITWLERQTVVIDGVRFVGTTLWTDFEALVDPQADAARQQQQREKAYRAANFYLRKNTSLHQGRPQLAEDLAELGRQCQHWLRETLSTSFDGPTVVVTHFAPSLRSADPRYGLVPGTAGFCNALDDLLPCAQLWMHGHLHCRVDYVAEGTVHGRPWRCRVVANPLGYAHKGERDGFDAMRVFEVTPGAIL
ncbi:metallophosphoesterase [Caldimonas taiwanensis]|uniref:metallophosphoesterase n=1 Tax=Caldimonas taiwanensis TaxID=307483 RepID=UPI0007867CE4|nr:metallophosphoesterase [Caldimonas taiwanensis]